MLPLTGKYQDILYGDDGAWQDHYPTRFAARRAVMLSAVGLGWTLDECHQEFTDSRNAGSRLWTHGGNDRLLGVTETSMRVMKDYEAAVKRCLQHPPAMSATEARQYVGTVIGLVNESEWKGVTGRTDRDVMLYVCSVATKVGCRTVNVSVRDVALGAGVTRPTASRSLVRLVKARWLERVGKRQFGIANLYKVRFNETYSSVGSSNRPICLKTTHPSHEVWIRLGKSAMALWAYLDEFPQSARSLGRQAGVSASAARRNLDKLLRFGLAVQSDDGWSAGPLGPDAVSQHWGWFGENSLAVYRQMDVADDRRIFELKFGPPEG